MPDDVDRSLLRLAVDNGFLTRDEGMRYWQQLQAPGSPRFVQLLLQSGRLGRPEVDRLRALWQQQSGGGHSTSGITAAFARPPLPQTAGGGGPAVAVAPAPAAVGAAPSTSQSPASTDDGSWEEALEKDTQLARVLYSRGLVTQERLRECRALQLQHRLRLGVVLVRKNYVDRAAVDDALRSLSGSGSHAAHPPIGSSGTHASLGASTHMQASAAQGRPLAPPPGPPGGLGASTRMQAPQPTAATASGLQARPPAHASSNPFQAPPGEVDQDAMPTLNVPPGSFPPGGPFATPRQLTPQDAIPTLLGAGDVSVEELNPFAVMGGAAMGGAAVSGAASGAPGFGSRAAPGAPGRGNGALSVDELNAFDDVPLGPPPAGSGAPFDGPTASGEDITLPPSWSPAVPAAPAAPEAPAPGPEDHLPASGGERPAAAKRKTAAKKASQPPSSGGGSSKALIIFVVVAALIATAAGLFLAFA